MPVGYYRDVPAASPTDPPGAHRIRGPLGVQAPRGLAETSLSDRGRSAARASVHPGGQFRLTSSLEQDPARGRLRFRSHSDDRAEAEAATVAVQMSIPWTYFSFSCWARSFSTKGHRNTRTPTPATRAAASVSST